jgi:hypothetical protein
MPFLCDQGPRSPEARTRERAALESQIELLEDEWRTGMERDTLVLLDRACARLAALDEEQARADPLRAL